MPMRRNAFKDKLQVEREAKPYALHFIASAFPDSVIVPVEDKGAKPGAPLRRPLYALQGRGDYVLLHLSLIHI